MKTMPDKYSDVEIIASTRRVRSISAKVVDGRIQVRVPAHLSAAQRDKEVAAIVRKLRAKLHKDTLDNDQLCARAHTLNARYLENRASFSTITWVSNQHQRWGSTTVKHNALSEIRISHRLAEVPDYVLDAVIIHELVHTFVPGGHTAEFWLWADRAPKAERAKGFLEAYSRFGG
ncbi:SprT-like domain-containing protein [Corynebacterium sp. SY003]|uniref:SprT-like domain-containing protein n=2 Tax=unclassified Corynebacterium TaxID=2624378 RepID=UPI00351B8240